MAFTTYCLKKGCNRQQEPLLDLTTGEVRCIDCNETITSITPFAKAQLKALGQTTRTVKSQKAFAVTCAACKKEGAPSLIQDRLLCGFCKKELTGLSKPFEMIVKNALKTGKAVV